MNAVWPDEKIKRYQVAGPEDEHEEFIRGYNQAFQDVDDFLSRQPHSIGLLMDIRRLWDRRIQEL